MLKMPIFKKILMQLFGFHSIKSHTCCFKIILLMPSYCPLFQDASQIPIMGSLKESFCNVQCVVLLYSFVPEVSKKTCVLEKPSFNSLIQVTNTCGPNHFCKHKHPLQTSCENVRICPFTSSSGGKFISHLVHSYWNHMPHCGLLNFPC